MSVYRVAGLPTGLSKAGAKEILDEVFGTETQTIVRSLGLYPYTDSLFATVMFFPVPSPLLEGHSWKFDKTLSFEGHVRRVQLEIDTAFLGFTPLNVVEDTQDDRIDCVVVSGLSSHPFGSWKERGGQFMWLVDDDTAFPSNVRVLLYGYDTSLFGSESFQTVTDIGERLATSVRSVRSLSTDSTKVKPRPIVFIAHSLGGLVVKEAIHSLAKKDDSNAKCIYGLVFFCVPHQGLLVEPWLRLISEQPNRQLVENLKPKSPYLKKLDKNFKAAIVLKDLKVVSIYETMTSQTTHKDSSGAVGRTGDREVLVPISSALGDWPESVIHGRVAINRTHDNLPKFRGRFDEDYQTVKHCLQDIWATAVEDVQKRFAADEKPTNSSVPSVEKVQESLSEKEVPIGLIPLWPSPETEEVVNIQTEVDLIAIHGLGGHAIETWTEGDRFWLRDFLPSDLPTVRVLTFGFDGSLVFTASKSNIPNIATQLLFSIKQLRRRKAEAAERKIIFVCHGFGGIVFKQAMVMACESESRYSEFGKSVAGVIFLGTPHKKADIGYWSKLLAKAALLHELRPDLLSNLDERAIELGAICSGFVERGMPPGLQVFSLYEQRITAKLGSLVVDESSAILHLTAETPLPLNADHDNMSRYLTESNPNYMTVFNCIAEWLLDHPDFQSWTKPQGHQVTWLHGPPGSGKTVLMRGIVAHLIEQSESSGDTVIRKPLYFFFDDKNSTRKTSAAFVRSILSQILVDERTSYLIKFLEGRDYKEDAEMEENLWICLSTVIERSRGIMFQFVIDAIDEVLRSSAGAPITILDRLEQLITQDLSGRVKLMLSDRKMPQNEFMETAIAIIDVDNDSNRQSVKSFVGGQIRKHLQRSYISVSTGEVVENKIMEISRGNFLHARLAWDQLSEGITEWSRDQIYKSLDQLTTISRGLVAAYCKLLSSIPRALRSKAKASFAILRISQEKLTSRQLAFLATLHDQKLDERPSLWSELHSQSADFENYLAEACGYVIRRADDGSVDFNHVSAKDLFTDSMEGLSPEEQQVISTFAVSDADAHAMMHSLCMSIFRLENREADYWRRNRQDMRQAQGKLRASFGVGILSIRQSLEIAELGVTRIESIARTPCFTYAIRHYISHYEGATPSPHADSALVSFMPSRQAYYCHRMWLEIRTYDTDHHLNRSKSVHTERDKKSTSSKLSKSAALFRLMARGDCPQIVKGLAAQGADINHVAGSDFECLTLLSWAIICRRKDTFCALLRDENVLINSSPDRDYGPLHHATRCVDDMFYIQRLLEHPDTNVNILHALDTPLHQAIKSKNLSGVEALLAHPDIDLSITDLDNETPYFKAFKHKMWEPLLIRMMTMVSKRTLSKAISGTSPLLMAGIHGWTHVEESILKMFPNQVLMQDPDTKMNVLAHYAFYGRREKLLWIMNRLPSQHASLRSEADHYDLLHLCANQNWEDIVHLMQRKYRLQSLSSDHVGRTLLHWALEYNWDFDRIDLSQYSMADLNKMDRDGLTAVHIAVTSRNMAALEILVASGASCLQKDKTGMSPAHMAADQGYRAALEYFIDSPHADFGTTRTGASLLHLMALWFDGAMVRRFVTSRKATLNINAVDLERRTALHYAAMANNASATDALVALGCGINERDNNGKSPLHEAIRGGGADAALRLLHLGADWRATDAFDQTCLHLSLRYDSDSLVSRFLRLGLDIGAVDRFGMTPLHRACGAGNVDHIRELLRKGAVWDARNMYGRSPLELAVEARTKSTVQTMVSWVLTLKRAQISGSQRRVRRYLDSALKLACELECTHIGSILKEAGADIDYSKVKVKRLYRIGPVAEPGRDTLVPIGEGSGYPFRDYDLAGFSGGKYRASYHYLDNEISWSDGSYQE
ncbi:hypothetical protein CORC01_02228 [Colletotrichum orchidophilum]|uniref:Uncharacterized protein n=1 Tax=Colletotrichum orchidophilum TaxID=1209926 RepID=A0A1G4BML9_9PEZI|nr:uncharacterized protein CORC01_02228 [Colletotrichum orchidophilum]OHF02533.1 hypothetical protein CORC01_02228 [Colletotrichum orchidophilum]